MELEAKYRLDPITHHWPEDRKLLMRAIKDYGYGGVVTNVPFENGLRSIQIIWLNLKR